ncbi:MAG: transcriptional regulator, family [Solirubrobacterales bacterium]|nr:transcriptional regulator, family [Solirubrobacterales bacterium]
MDFGTQIRELRLEQGLTQRDLADAAGLNYSYISKIESGRLAHTPSSRAVAALARALAVDELELLGSADKVPEALAPMLANPEAVSFLRKAATRVQAPEDWRYLSRLLDEVPVGQEVAS